MLCGAVAACVVCVLFVVRVSTQHSEQYAHHTLTCCHTTP